MNPLLKHVMDVCDDPDCEIHQIRVGLEERTVAPTDLAFFLAGAQAMELATRREFYKRVPWEERGPRVDLHEASLIAGREMFALVEKFFPETFSALRSS